MPALFNMRFPGTETSKLYPRGDDPRRISERVRKLSKPLLGSQFRAEVAAFIADGDPPFWARRMSTQLEIPENKVSGELSRFAAQDLLTELTGDPWDRRTLYEPAAGSSAYWDAAKSLVRRAADAEALEQGVSAEATLSAYLSAVHGRVPGRKP